MTDPAPKSWFGRNWKWVVPVGCLGAFVLVAGFVGAIAFGVFAAMKSSGAFTESMALLNASAEAREALGEPIEAGWLVTGSINVTGASGEADLALPVRGPRNRGWFYVVAEKRAGRWSFEILELEVEDSKRRIDLLSSSE